MNKDTGGPTKLTYLWILGLQTHCMQYYYRATSKVSHLPLLWPASYIYQIAVQLFKLTRSI